MALGLYCASRPATRAPVRVFRSAAEAKLAARRGEIGLNDPIEVTT
jgi:hypothetical protein